MAKIRDVRLSALLLLCMLGAAAADDFTVSAPTTLSRLLITTLRCTTTETRTYLYSSDNRLWGPTGQRFRTTAELHVYCIGAAGGRHGNNALLFGATVNHITEEPIDEPTRRTEFNSGELDAFDAEKDDALSKLASGRFSSPFVSARRKRQIDPSDPYPVDEQFQDPWKFVQGNDGTILEVRFMSSDTDEEARNFKRALTSAFQSQFNPQAGQKEITDITGKHFATFSFSTPTSSTSVVSKTYSNSDFTQFAAPSAAHDRDSVDINGAESETFSDGVLFQSTGTITARFGTNSGSSRFASFSASGSSQTDPTDDDPLLREPDVDIAQDLTTQVTYTMSLQTRRKRSLDDPEDNPFSDDNEVEYVSSGLMAEYDKDSGRRIRYETLIGSVGKVHDILTSFIRSRSEEKLDDLKDTVRMENELNIQDKRDSLSNEVAMYVGQIDQHECSADWDICYALYQVLSVGGGDAAERLILTSLAPVTSPLSDNQKADLLNLLGGMPRASDRATYFLARLLTTGEPSLVPNVLVNMASVASRTTVTEGARAVVTNILDQRLGQNVDDARCSDEESVVDLLQSIGNLGETMSDRVIDDVIRVGDVCADQEAAQQASVYALRDVIANDKVQRYYQHLMETEDCTVKASVVTTLMDRIMRITENQYTEGRDSEWPKSGFSALDEFIGAHMGNLTQEYACITDEMYRYMSMKQNDEAKAVVEEFQKLFLVEETYELDDDEDESESNTTMADDGGHRRRKRAWTHSSCSDWGHSTYYNIIQSSSQFSSDKSSHNRRRHCLAYKYIGVSKANAKMYGGMFAGRHSSNGRYKLFTKLVGRAQLFSKTFDVGTILSYRIKSSSGSITQRNYMVIAGKSLLDSKSTSCTTRTWAYEHNFYIPIYKINIWVASIDVGAQIRPRFEMNFICTSSSNTVITKVQPKAILRVVASAQASLAKLVRGGLTIGINLNFYVETVTESVPCIAGYYGYDPMSISIEAWYQFRSKIKVQIWPPKIKWTWGKRYTWRPSSLKWKITSGYRRSWLSRRCDGSTPLGPLLTNAAKK